MKKLELNHYLTSELSSINKHSSVRSSSTEKTEHRHKRKTQVPRSADAVSHLSTQSASSTRRPTVNSLLYARNQMAETKDDDLHFPELPAPVFLNLNLSQNDKEVEEEQAITGAMVPETLGTSEAPETEDQPGTTPTGTEARVDSHGSEPENGEREEKNALLKEEVYATLNEQIGRDWFESKPLYWRVLFQLGRICLLLALLYLFLVSLGFISNSLTVLTGKSAGQLFEDNQSPIVGLMIGVLATVLVQSSSTTTSIIVTLVANKVLQVQIAVPMIMGVNIGTAVTNTIVSLGFIDDPDAYRRGFAGATVHDMFNYLNIFLFLPFDFLIAALNSNGIGLLQTIAEGITKRRGNITESSEVFDVGRPVRAMTESLVDLIIKINQGVLSDYATGFPNEIVGADANDCDTSFTFQDEEVSIPDVCDPEGTRTCDFCTTGIFDESLFDEAKAAFDAEKLIESGALSNLGDEAGGILGLVLSLLLLILSLFGIVRILTRLVHGSAKKVLVKTMNYNFTGGGYLAILVGCVLTLVVQSSSITTSLLTPLVAVDALSLENMFPFTLGANIGTTGTGLIAAAVNGDRDGYTIALVHFFFNLFGTIIWYPIPSLRNIPLSAARFLGEMAHMWKFFPMVYILVLFVIYPLSFFGAASLFSEDSQTIGIILAVFCPLAFFFVAFSTSFWYRKKNGKNKLLAYVEARKRRTVLKDKED